MSLSYRHKQTVIIFIVCILGVGVAGYAVYGKSWQNKTPDAQRNGVVDVVSTDTTPIANTDDWKNQFLISSTSAEKSFKGTTLANTEPKEPETITGQFGKRFFEQYMILKQSNLTENPEAVKAVVDQNIANLVATAPQARIYDVREISLSQNSGSTEERGYLNAVGTLFSSYMPKKDAATIALQALEEDDRTKIKEVESIATAYETILKQLLLIPTPKSLAGYQVKLVNAVSAVSFASKGMTNVFADPLQSIPALAVYEKSIGQFRDALLDLKFFFNQRNIQFSNNEPAIIIFSMTN